MTDARRHAPATERNREPILAVLREFLPETGTVLEIAAGSGEHAVHFAKAFPALSWQPTDPDADARGSIDAWAAQEGVANLRPALLLDAASADWPVDRADTIVCINMIHISPWEATEGLLRGAGRLLPASGVLYLYGPYRREGRVLEPSNAAFDESLKARDPRWGLRLLEDVVALAAEHGLTLAQVVDMPANNLSVVFRRD
ncbi:MAG: DUF938 domain-containing protein [Xanthobacteraceae bacterium]